MIKHPPTIHHIGFSKETARFHLVQLYLNENDVREEEKESLQRERSQFTLLESLEHI
jgi:hypothetical protein